MVTRVNNRMIDGASINVLDFGADPTGTSDSTAAFQLAMDKGGDITVPSGNYLISNINSTVAGTSLVFEEDAWIYPQGSTTNVITLTNGRCSVVGGQFDYSNTPTNSVWTPLNLAGFQCEGELFCRNMTVDADTPDTAISVVKVQGNECVVHSVRGDDLTNIGLANESLPHIVDVQNAAQDTHIKYVYGDVCVAGVIQASGLRCKIDTVLLRNATDNGIYMLGSAEDTNIGFLFYDGLEEPYVDKGKNTYAERIVIRNRGLGIGIDDNPTPSHIGWLSFIGEQPGVTAPLVQSRNSNVQSAGIIIDRVDGVSYANTDFQFNNGIVDYVKIHNNNLLKRYTNNNSSRNLLTHQLGEEFDLRDWNVILEDTTGSLGASDFFDMAVLPAVSKQSYISDLDIKCEGSFTFRCRRWDQALVEVKNQIVQDLDPNYYIRERGFQLLGTKKLYMSAPPTSFAWAVRGDEVINPVTLSGQTISWRFDGAGNWLPTGTY